MGEVYRARDERLKRDVAIKVLPSSFSKDSDRLRRFELEAQAAGGLNHPNITAVYDVGRHEGAPYVVQELLEGETLRAELAGGGGLAPRKAIGYATQIAEGLAAAHEKGIVHRDLKPENVFVTRDGRVKILDFGLAKLIQAAVPAEEQTSAPTASRDTEPGVVMGTVGYMSPEQVKGQSSDHRSDIFGFGSILYEMLAGRRPFKGDSAVETMSAILREDPPQLSGTNRNLPPGLERIVHHCLEKNPSRRFQSARDVAYDLEALSGVSGTAAAAGSLRRASSLRRWAAGGAFLVVASALAFTAYVAGGRRAGAGASLPVFKRLTFRRGLITGARFAPDGKTTVYSAAWEGQPSDVFLARADSGESKPFGLPNSGVLAVSRADQIAVSLRGQSAEGPSDTPGTLASVPLLGGAPRSILDDVLAADWGPDGKEMAIVRSVAGKYVLEFPVGTRIDESPFSLYQARISPDGRRVAYVRQYVEKDELVVADRSGNKKVLFEGFLSWPGPVWRPSGQELWLTAWNQNKTGSSIFSVTLDGTSKQILALPDDMGLFDVRSDGAVLIERRSRRAEVYFRGPGDARDRNVSWLDGSVLGGVSADGQSVLLGEWANGGETKGLLFLRGTDGSRAVRIGEGRALDISADGKWALSLLDEKLRLNPTGVGQARELPTGNLRILNAAFLPDARRVLLGGTQPSEHKIRLWVLDLAGGPLRPLSEGPKDVDLGAISPDGTLVAIRLEKEDKIVLLPIGDGPRRFAAGTLADDSPIQWSPDGRWLYVLRKGDPFRNQIYRVELATGRRELWKEIAPDDRVGTYGIRDVALTPDGRGYAYSLGRTASSDLYLVEGLR
jgi:dipeptidyl aminopeptidase/acylaminoacyl peptidase